MILTIICHLLHLPQHVIYLQCTFWFLSDKGTPLDINGGGGANSYFFHNLFQNNFHYRGHGVSLAREEMFTTLTNDDEAEIHDRGGQGHDKLGFSSRVEPKNSLATLDIKWCIPLKHK